MPVVIAGFKPIQRLGVGGMGEVWQVEEESTGKRYALKTMLQQRGADEYAKLSFLRESAMGEALRHKNIIRVYKTGYESGVFYILMELCTGGNADDYRKRAGGKLPLDVATYIILQALDGLDYAHNADILVECAGKKISTRGVVHRDFKPGNVFLADDSAYPEVRVADFGLAKAFETAGLSQNTRTGIAAGTPVFQPRAQIRNYKYSQPDVDVWAAAACYYYLLTGQFVKDLGGGDVWMAMYERDAVPIRQRDKNIPPTLAAVIDEVLAERANTGIKTAKEFKTEIVKALPAEIKTKVLQVI